jgi:glycosyltransferase involved in cell wall biosynthesis
VGAHPPAPRFGGVQAQWLARLGAEQALRPTAILYPEAGEAGNAGNTGGYRLEVSTGPGGERRAFRRPGRPPARRALRDPDFEAAVAWAAARVGARALQVEGAAGLPPASLLQLAREGLPLVLALHDFALFCPRPHLLEEPFRRFCGYCRDLPRCAACLGEAPEFQARWREAGAALLTATPAVLAVVFPSAFLARTHAELFGPLLPHPRVIPPARPPSGPLPAPLSDRSPSGPLRHLALVGGVQAHKGAEIFLEVVERLDREGRTDLAWSAYGGGDPALLARLRQTGRVRVRGYYRAGSLPRLLRRDRVDLAILPSVVPESFSLVLSECRAAGVPVLAFDLGAVGERLRNEGGGLAVPPAAGAAGMAALAAEVTGGGRALPPLAARTEPKPGEAESGEPEPGEIAGRWLNLYRELGLA